jgi:hypothetical protein
MEDSGDCARRRGQVTNLNGTHCVLNNNQVGASGPTTFFVVLENVQGFDISDNEMLAPGANSALVAFGTGTNHGQIKRNQLNKGFLVSSLTSTMNDIDIDQNFLVSGGTAILTVQKPFNGPTSTPSASKVLWRDASAGNAIKGAA